MKFRFLKNQGILIKIAITLMKLGKTEHSDELFCLKIILLSVFNRRCFDEKIGLLKMPNLSVLALI